jgi:hypothetical protein
LGDPEKLTTDHHTVIYVSLETDDDGAAVVDKYELGFAHFKRSGN